MLKIPTTFVTLHVLKDSLKFGWALRFSNRQIEHLGYQRHSNLLVVGSFDLSTNIPVVKKLYLFLNVCINANSSNNIRTIYMITFYKFVLVILFYFILFCWRLLNEVNKKHFFIKKCSLINKAIPTLFTLSANWNWTKPSGSGKLLFATKRYIENLGRHLIISKTCSLSLWRKGY